jgi:hypothetical protein
MESARRTRLNICSYIHPILSILERYGTQWRHEQARHERRQTPHFSDDVSSSSGRMLADSDGGHFAFDSVRAAPQRKRT